MLFPAHAADVADGDVAGVEAPGLANVVAGPGCAAMVDVDAVVNDAGQGADVLGERLNRPAADGSPMGDAVPGSVDGVGGPLAEAVGNEYDGDAATGEHAKMAGAPGHNDVTLVGEAGGVLRADVEGSGAADLVLDLLVAGLEGQDAGQVELTAVQVHEEACDPPLRAAEQ